MMKERSTLADELESVKKSFANVKSEMQTEMQSICWHVLELSPHMRRALVELTMRERATCGADYRVETRMSKTL